VNTSRSTLILALSSLLACHSPGRAQEREGADMTELREFDASQAEARVREHIADLPLLADAGVWRVAELDVGDYFAFSVIPEMTGLAGESLYLVSSDDMVLSGQPADFDRLMATLGVGSRADVLDVKAFAQLFVRVRAVRRGVILDRPDGHPLIQPGQIPDDAFFPPQAEFEEGTGAHFRFWLFDTDRYEAFHFEVDVAPDGSTRFSEST
jgi:hypothetical protein